MSTEFEAVDPYLRGAAFPGVDNWPYPRADPTDFRLPQDTWATAQLPVGVRLEFATDAEAVEIDYSCATDDLGYRGEGAGTTFEAWRGDAVVATAAAQVGRNVARLSPVGGDGTVVVAVPEGMRPTLHGIRAIGGSLTPTPAGPRWIAYGDSITEGWTASSPGRAWPAIAGRAYGLDVVNLGYAGSCRGEIASAEQVSGLPADVISLAYGTNCWSRPPHSTGMLREGMRAWLSIVREGHPTTPIVVLSPIVRPEADNTPNRLGASLSDLRAVVEEVAQERRAAGDANISLIPGADLITAEQLSDGVHPTDEGHQVLARVVGEAVAAAVGKVVDAGIGAGRG